MKTFRYFLNEMSKPELMISDLQRQNAKDNVSQAIVHMHPNHFLQLTTGSSLAKEQIKRNAQPLENYNKYSGPGGDSIVHPFLRVQLDDKGGGTVSGHEGRHRAAAVLNAGGNSMPVAIQLRPHRDMKKEKYDLGYDKHMPDHLTSQFNPHLTIAKSNFKVKEHLWGHQKEYI